jgi:hypothetical protein
VDFSRDVNHHDEPLFLKKGTTSPSLIVPKLFLLIPAKVVHGFFHDIQVVWRGIDRDFTALHQCIASRSMLPLLNGLLLLNCKASMRWSLALIISIIFGIASILVVIKFKEWVLEEMETITC